MGRACFPIGAQSTATSILLLFFTIWITGNPVSVRDAFKESKRSLHCTSQRHYAHAEASEYEPRIMS